VSDTKVLRPPKAARESRIMTAAYAAHAPGAPLDRWDFERRAPGPRDVVIDILYCGICHTDIHMVRNEWSIGRYPMVPGHEIVGRVSDAGADVTKCKAGDAVGVGCFVDSCRECSACRDGDEQYCEQEPTLTYSSLERDGKTLTQGGYSTRIVVNEDYVFRLPSGKPLERVAPLLCAGITTYSPLRRAELRGGESVAVVGLGGLGHLGVRIARAMGAKVTVISHSAHKREDAKRLGAEDFIATSEPDAFRRNARRFDFILGTVSAAHDVNGLLGLLRRDGTMVMVGAPPQPVPITAFSLIQNRHRLGGSMIGGLRETQEMLDFCGDNGIVADVEVIPIQQVNDAFERTLRSDVRYRFVIDLSSLKSA
jgi:alcohol dehydrogenase (NADP+)